MLALNPCCFSLQRPLPCVFLVWGRWGGGAHFIQRGRRLCLIMATIYYSVINPQHFWFLFPNNDNCLCLGLQYPFRLLQRADLDISESNPSISPEILKSNRVSLEIILLRNKFLGSIHKDRVTDLVVLQQNPRINTTTKHMQYMFFPSVITMESFHRLLYGKNHYSIPYLPVYFLNWKPDCMTLVIHYYYFLQIKDVMSTLSVQQFTNMC